MAAPRAVIILGWGGTSSLIPSFSSIFLTSPISSPPPPLMAQSGSSPTLPMRADILSASALCTPARVSSLGMPSATRDIASDSPKTAQLVVTVMGFSAFRERGPMSLRSIWRTLAMTSRKRPLPAAHFSLATKLMTILPLICHDCTPV